MTCNRDALLRQALWLDAIVSGATGALLWAAAGALAGLLGLPRPLLAGAGLVCLVYAAALVLLARRTRIARGAAMAVVAGNGLWVAASLWLLVSGLVMPTLAGQAFVLFQAAAVLGLAVLQWIGLSRIVGATMAA
jgi:hypothetical protein